VDADSGYYAVVAAPAGAVVPYLPGGATSVPSASGMTLYKYADVLYEPVYDGAELAYKVVYI
jgi:hypothetical protein